MTFWIGIAVTLALGPSGAVQSVDAVPRDRLLSHAELLGALDLSRPELHEVKRMVESGDSSGALDVLGEHMRTRSNPRYFFSTDELGARLEDFKRRYPDAVERMRDDTRTYVARFGSDADWMIPGRDRKGNAHDPNVVRYLARQANAEAFALSHLLSESDQLQFIRSHVRDFVSDYEAGLTQGEPNDVFERFYAGHRTRNWLVMHHLLRADSRYGSADEIFMLRVFLLHGARLYDQSRRFNWGNHQLHGLAGLYEMTMMYPEVPVMRFWNEQALILLAEHLEREVAEDGFHFERASHYHLLDIVNYFRVYRIAGLNGAELPNFYAERFQRMFDAVVALSLPERAMPIIQDVSADFDVRTDPVAREMAIGALVFASPEYRFFAADRLPPEFYWFFDADAPERYEQIRPTEPEIRSTALSESRFFAMRTGWDNDDLYLLIDGGLAREKPDHTQGGILGLIGYGFGEQFLPNYPVMYRHPSYKTLKNSYAKSVAMVDGRPQGREWIDNKSRTGFGIWGELPEPAILEWTSGDRFDVFRGTHDGYADLGVTYSRQVYFFKPYFWVVIDAFEGERVHDFQQIWQGSYSIPDHEPRPFHHSAVSYYVPDDPPRNRAIQEGHSSRFHVVQADPDRMTTTKRRDYFVDSVVFETAGYSDYTFTTLLYPEAADESGDPRIRHFRRPGSFEEIVATADDVAVYVYLSDDEELEVERVESDARRVALTYVSDELDALLLTDGRRVATADFELSLDSAADVEISRGSEGWTIRSLSDTDVSAVFSECMRTTNLRLQPGQSLHHPATECPQRAR